MENKERVDILKSRYRKGTKVRLYHMKGEARMPPGLVGQVKSVDDMGQIHVLWENGSSSVLNTEKDLFEIMHGNEESEDHKFWKLKGDLARIFAGIDFGKLRESCNGNDTSYAQGLLLELYRAFIETYGNSYMEKVHDMIFVPALIFGKNTGEYTVALLLMDLKENEKIWGSIFMTEDGPVAYGGTELTERQYKMVTERYLPYEYWCILPGGWDQGSNLSLMPKYVRQIREQCEFMQTTCEESRMDTLC